MVADLGLKPHSMEVSVKVSFRSANIFQFIISFSFFFSMNLAQAQDESYTSVLRKSGNLVNIEVVPGSRQLKVFVVGKNLKTFKFQNLSAEAFLKGKSATPLALSKDKDFFLVDDPRPAHHEIILKIKDGGQSDQVEVPLKKN